MTPVWILTVALTLWVVLVPRAARRYGWWLVAVVLAAALIITSVHALQGR